MLHWLCGVSAGTHCRLLSTPEFQRVANTRSATSQAIQFHPLLAGEICPRRYHRSRPVFCLGFFCMARRPAPFSWRPAILKKPKWRPALLTNFFFFKYQSHMAFSSVFPFLLPTHSVDCAVHLLLSHSRALLVSSALFHPFTVLIMPIFFSSPR